jgi:hypothetical protein
MLLKLYDPATQTEYFGNLSALIDIGPGLQLVDGELSIKIQFSALVADENGIYVAVGGIQNGHIQDAAINAAKLAANAVTTAKILDGNVTSAKLGMWAVTAGKIFPGSVGSDELAWNSISANNLMDESVGVNQLHAPMRKGFSYPLYPLYLVQSAAAVNNGPTTFTPIADPGYRAFVNLRGITKVRFIGRLGGTLHASTVMRIQYNTSSDPTILTGWATLADSPGGHTSGLEFDSGEINVPSGAQILNCQLRLGIYGGNSAADPTLYGCVLNFYTP